jgi:hypothetical protein
VKRTRLDRAVFSHHNDDHGFDAVLVDKNGKLTVIEAKAGTGKTQSAIRLFIDGSGDELEYMSVKSDPPWTMGKFGRSKPRVLVEGDTEQALFSALRADGAGARLGRLGFAPPRLADLLISLIPLKHRETLAGDLEEDYWTRFIPRHGLRMARVLYCVQAIYAFLGFLARPLTGIVGIHWVAKVIDYIISRLLK